ncbi:hypothetical protein TcWFU_005248 [Taenia crassiceps]|uniref:Uncharacterized protein n=1 Tax=Taenia crassiceps TaxID=6207 RepID=A0ABR4QBW9_9CEST
MSLSNFNRAPPTIDIRRASDSSDLAEVYCSLSNTMNKKTSSLGEDTGEFDFSDVHSSCLALNPAPNRRTSFLYRPDSSEDASSYSSRRPSVSCGDAMNL